MENKIFTTYVIALMLLLVNTIFATEPLYTFASPKQAAQFQHLLYDLRCLVCQNQNLADSNADLAKDLRQEVYNLVQQGHSDQEIYQYLTKRYGDFILFNPPVKAITLLLWLSPGLFLCLGIYMFIRKSRLC